MCSFDGVSWRSYAAVDGVDGSVIASLSTDSHGNVWAATELGVSVHTRGNWVSFDASDGLPDDQLLSVAADDAGNVFVGTAKSGIWCWCEGTVMVLALPEGVIDGLYHIAQEALNNALKHAEADAVTVTIRSDGETVTPEVVDDGQGFDTEAVDNGGGMGLESMRERAAQLGADLVIDSAPGEGTRVRVSVGTPLSSHEHMEAAQ